MLTCKTIGASGGRSEEVGLRYGREAPAGRRLEPAWFKTYRDTVDEPKTTGVKGLPEERGEDAVA